jgi:hypothetical protein
LSLRCPQQKIVLYLITIIGLFFTAVILEPQFKINNSLLEPDAHPIGPTDYFSMTLDALGVYSPTQFAVRLKPKIHQLIDSISTGVHSTAELDGDTIQAFSTYLHETIHWWQHMGSTAGFIQSLVYPAQAHQNQEYLKEVLHLIGPKKPLKRWAEDAARAGITIDNTALKSANIAVNNAVDFEFYKFISINPEKTGQALESPYFESVGHCYWMAYGNVVALLSATVDRENRYLPYGLNWDDGFNRVRSENVEGFVHGGRVRMPPLGSKALFEGQARFIQMQYLTFGVKEPPSFEALRADGFFDGIYGQAFELFLKIVKVDCPKKLGDPLVALFLLIVDLAINPTAGFPLDIESFENFIRDVDPGLRFFSLCHAASARPQLFSTIRQYSGDEYLRVADELTQACGYDHPVTALNRVLAWADESPGIQKIMKEKTSFLFEPSNLVVRVLFSHFIDFCRDKLKNPEFFCWTGAWMAGSRACETSQKLFLGHLSLYTNRGDKDGIFPRLFPDKDEDGLKNTLNIFYQNVILYDLTKQWTLTPGEFKYDYEWLSDKHSYDALADWAKKLFNSVYGVSPDEFEVL